MWKAGLLKLESCRLSGYFRCIFWVVVFGWRIRSSTLCIPLHNGRTDREQRLVPSETGRGAKKVGGYIPSDEPSSL